MSYVKMADIRVQLTILLIFNFISNIAALSSISNKVNQIVFVYPNGVNSERDLNICQEKSACNIIYKRFWLPPLVERLCRCQTSECSWSFSQSPDNYTMALDNRSQLKFCSEVTKLPKCTVKKPALLTITKKSNHENMDIPDQHHAHYPLKNGYKPIRSRDSTNVTAFCHCQDPHYWKIKPNATKFDIETNQLHQSYLCTKLRKCTRAEFCGYIRADTFSTFYRCSCPRGHLCISKDKTIHNAEEILFNGPSYKAHCFPHGRT